eukprot:TRINITY_DN24123_c0_g1_i1.p1 TRINITY_DN24123_c0_g1~~TRINITY_DN24123_c0_g1_i1.p1  ORF type:complete len:1203 (-),score=150.86 TRINITY_DN24123_c0_g1_i1:144-3752(-)
MAQLSFVIIAVLAALILPCILVIIGVIGLNKLQVQEDIDGIWRRQDSDFSKNRKYENDLFKDKTGGTSMLLGIAVPRSGGSMMKAAHLMELQQRMNLSEHVTATVDDITLTYDDVCYNLAGAYQYPCFRMTILDCFSQGGYDFSKFHQDTFQALIVGRAMAVLRPPIINTGLASTVCKASCNVDGQAASIVATLGQKMAGPAGTWESQPRCKGCMDKFVSEADPKVLDAVYKQTLTVFLATVQNIPVASLRGQDIDELVSIALRTALQLNGKSPYTWQMGVNLFPQGYPRPSLVNPNGSYMTDAEVLATVSGTCYAWDEGQAIPPINKYLALAGYSKANTPMQETDAVQNVFLFKTPEAIQTLLKSGTAALHRPGGALNITLDQAKEALSQFKSKFERFFSQGWKDSKHGDVEFTAWSDDVGAGGTTRNMLGDMTMKALPQAIIFFVIVILLSAAFFIRASSPLRESRCLLAFVGAVLVIIGVVASIGMLAFFNIKMNVSMSYTMPFIMVGILCDDMYMLILSVDTTDAGLSPDQRFLKAMRSVGVPITVTSVVNFGVFLTLFVVSDLPAIYDIGVTGMVCTSTTFLMLMVSFSALVYLDLLRRTARRMDCGFCCIKLPHQAQESRTAGEEGCHIAKEAGEVINVSPGLLYRRLYQPMLRSWVGKTLVLVIGAACMIVAVIGLTDIEVGLDLEDLYPANTQPNQFIARRMKYFPVWPAGLNFGQLDYKSPDVQLKMAKAWENVLATPYVAPGATTPLLWTVAFASWGMSSSIPAFSSSLAGSPCSLSNPYTNGMCAEKIHAQYGGPECKATLWENTLGLKHYDQGGFCLPGPMVGINDTKSYCPVYDFATAEDHAACFARWNKHTRQVSLTAPGILMESDGITPKVPIALSKAGGSMLYVYNLYETSDYVQMMKDTRKYMDDDKSMHSWMNGIAYAYWEQYLTIIEFMWSVGAWAAGAGFVISFVFLLLELTASRFGKLGPRIYCSLIGALLIMGVLVTSMLTVWGWMALAKIQLSAFSAMAILFASGFAIEYAVHIVHHFLESQAVTAVERIDYAMRFLFHPTAMAATSSFVSVFVLVFANFRFITKFFFAPLVMVVVVTYFYGAILLPCTLSFMGFLPRLGPNDGLQVITQEESGQAMNRNGAVSDTGTMDTNSSLQVIAQAEPDQAIDQKGQVHVIVEKGSDQPIDQEPADLDRVRVSL